MISRRGFIQGLGSLAVLLSIPFSAARAVYEKSVITLTDFGGLIHKPIKGFCHQTAQAQKIIADGGLLHPRGTAHSVMGKSMRAGATIFTPEGDDIVFKDGVVSAPAGVTLFDIDNFLEPYGYMLPTSPDIRTVSLGGVLSVGGFGMEVCRYGPLIDHVEHITLLTQEGEILEKLPARDSRVTKVLAGIGRQGTILSAAIRCLKKPLKNFIRKDPIPDVDSYYAMVRDYMQDPERDTHTDIWRAYLTPRSAHVYRGKMIYDGDPVDHYDPEIYQEISDYRSYFHGPTKLWAFGRSYQYYVWSDHLVPLDTTKQALEKGFELRQKGQDLGGEVVFYSVVTKTHKETAHFPHYSDQDYVLSIGVYGNFLADHKQQAKEFARLQMLYSKQFQDELKGVPYRYGWEWQEDFKDISFD